MESDDRNKVRDWIFIYLFFLFNFSTILELVTFLSNRLVFNAFIGGLSSAIHSVSGRKYTCA